MFNKALIFSLKFFCSSFSEQKQKFTGKPAAWSVISEEFHMKYTIYTFPEA